MASFIVYNAALLVWYTRYSLTATVTAPPSPFSSMPCVTVCLGTEQPCREIRVKTVYRPLTHSTCVSQTVTSDWTLLLMWLYFVREWYECRRIFSPQNMLERAQSQSERAHWTSHLVIIVFFTRDVVCCSNLGGWKLNWLWILTFMNVTHFLGKLSSIEFI